MRARGARWCDIASRFDGVSQRQAQRIFASWRDDESSSEFLNAGEVIRSTIELLRQGIADMAALEMSADNDNARIGATRLKVEIAERLIVMLRAVGVLPRNLGSFAVERQVQEMMREFIDLLRRHEVPAELLQDLQALADSRRDGHAPASPAWLTEGEAA